MLHLRKRRAPRLAILAAVACTAGLAAPGAAQAAELFYGITDGNRLVSFTSQAPARELSSVPLSGLNTGESILAIDVRPLTDQLYGVSNQNRIYTINKATGGTRRINGPFAPGLTSGNVGFDFNPTVDRIRVVTESDQNLRLNPATGTTAAVDTPLTYAPGDPGMGQNPTVAASAYTNSFPGATTTQLYGIDSARDTLVRQDPPNAGTLRTVGALGADGGESNGFDVATDGNAYLVSKPSGTGPNVLYRVDLTTGRATALGSVGTTATLRGLAAVGRIPDDRSRPAVVLDAERHQRKATLSTFGLSFKASCSERCTLVGSARIGLRTVGVVRTTLRTAAGARLRIRFTSAGRALLARAGTQRIALRVTATDAARNSTSVPRTIFAR